MAITVAFGDIRLLHLQSSCAVQLSQLYSLSLAVVQSLVHSAVVVFAVQVLHVRGASVSHSWCGRSTFVVRAFLKWSTAAFQAPLHVIQYPFACYFHLLQSAVRASSVCCACIFSLLMCIFRPSSVSLSPS